MKQILAAVVMACALAMTVRADDKDRDDHSWFFGHKHEHEFHADRSHGTIPSVPETNPAPVLGALFLIGAIAYEVKLRRAKAKVS